MSALGGSLVEARVLDLFAGSGALGIEALSRGAAEVVFVESAARASRVIRDNLALVAASDRARVVTGDALRFVERLGPREFDLALADPPYGRGYAEELVRRFAARPFAHALWVEHRTGELAAEAGWRTRRYGDTTLTTVTAPDEQA